MVIIRNLFTLVIRPRAASVSVKWLQRLPRTYQYPRKRLRHNCIRDEQDDALKVWLVGCDWVGIREILPIKLKKKCSTTVISNKLVRYSLKTTNNQRIKGLYKNPIILHDSQDRLGAKKSSPSTSTPPTYQLVIFISVIKSVLDTVDVAHIWQKSM